MISAGASQQRPEARVCTVWAENFPECGKSAQNQEVQPKKNQSPGKKEGLINPPRDCFFEEHFPFLLD